MESTVISVKLYHSHMRVKIKVQRLKLRSSKTDASDDDPCWSEGAAAGHCFIDITLLLRILLNFTNKLGLKFGNFTQEDENTYYYINGLRYKTYTVRQNPDVLNYPVYDWEKGKNASQLFNIALGKVSEEKLSICLKTHISVQSQNNGMLLQPLTFFPPFILLFLLYQLRDDLQKMGCEKMLNTYDSYSVKVTSVLCITILFEIL